MSPLRPLCRWRWGCRIEYRAPPAVFFDEIETDDPEAYIRQKFPDKNLKYEKTVEADGSLVFDIETSGIRQRFTFTEI